MVKVNNHSITLTSIIISLIGITIFMQASIIMNNIIYPIMILLVFLSIYYYSKSTIVNKNLLIFLTFFIFPSLLGVFSLPISYIFEDGRFNYDELNIFGRLFNIIILVSVIVFVDKYTSSRNKLLFFKWYKYGLLILIFSGLWHALSIYTNLVSFPFQTGSHLHSTYGQEYNFFGRVTGFANEPSYFVMFVVDFIALSLLFYQKLKKYFMIFIAIVLLLLSLSPSGYITLFLSFSGAYFFTNIKFVRKINIRHIFLGIIVFSILIFTTIKLLEWGLLEYIVNRITSLSIEKSERFYMNAMPFIWSSDSNTLSFLFGHGIKSYSIIGTEYLLPAGKPVHVTSNNFYVDTFWESGLIGLLVLLSFFCFIFVKIFKSRFEKYQIFIMFFVFFDLFFSGFFRADFATMRYFIMLYLLFVLLNNNIKSIKGRT